MVTKFNIQKKKSILCCIVDNMDLCQSGWAREVNINLTDFLIHRFALHDFDIYISKDEDQLLNAAAEDGYSHAVIIASGTSLGLSDRLFPAIDNLCSKDFFIAGHILDRQGHSFYKNACFELHHQFYIVNLQQYLELGSPLVGNEENASYEQYAPLRSQECLYDDHEVPVWIKRGTDMQSYDYKLHGWNILNVGLNNDKILIDLGEDIRNSKKYIYYEYDHVFIKMLAEIQYHEFFCNNFFAGWNSDGLKNHIPFEGPVEQYATVGIGFNWIRNLQLIGFTENTKVIFTDINNNCLLFMKKMVESWDGKDYADFYWTHKPMMPNNSPHIGESYRDQIAEQWEQFLKTIDNWEQLWADVKKIKFDFILIDYTASHNFDWLESNKSTLLNLSDLYTHAPFVATRSLKYRIACENRLFKSLTDHDPNITLMLTSRAADGYWPRNTRQLIEKVKDFQLTDIEELKKTPWHEKDWSNSGCRPLGT